MRKNKEGDVRSGIFKYKTLPEDNIPFACYVDPKTILNKNGEILQTLVIYFYDNKYNSTGQFKRELHDAIEKSSLGLESEKFSFWIHTIRARNQKIINTLRPKEPYNFVIDEIEARWNESVKELNYYDSVCYITIIHPCIPIKLSIKKIYTYLNGRLMSLFFKENIEKGKKTLNVFVARLYNAMIAKYFVERLEIKVEKDSTDAKHLNFFSKILNFDNVQHKVPLANISSFINKSKYSFGFGDIEIKMGERVRYATILTVKDGYSLTPDILTKIMNNSQDMIACEIFHQVDKKRGSSYYKSLFEFFYKKYEKDNSKLDSQPTLEAFDPKKTDVDKRIYSSYMGFMLISGSQAGLAKSLAKFCQNVKELGLVVAQEDIGIERAFYSFMPGNFRFIKHSSVVEFADIPKCSYAYSFDNENIKEYKDKKTILVLPTINNHTYAFGIIKDKPNIIITDAEYRQRTVLHNLIALRIKDSFDSDIYIIDNKNHNSTLASFMGGARVEIHKEPALSNGNAPMFDNHSGFDYKKEMEDFASILTSRIKAGNEKDAMITDLANDLFNIKSTQDLDGLVAKYSSSSISGILSSLFGAQNSQRRTIGFKENEDDAGFYSYYISRRVEIEVFEAYCKLFLDDVFKKKAKRGRHAAIVINNPFLMCKSEKVYASFKRLIESGDDCVFIFSCSNDDVSVIVGGDCLLSFEELSQNCDTFIHIGNEYLDERHKIAYGLSKAEFFGLEKIKMTNEVGMLKQGGLITPIKTALKPIGGFINDVLCDGDAFRKQIARYFVANKNSDMEECFDYFLEQEAMGKVLSNIDFEGDVAEKSIKQNEEKDEKHKKMADDIFEAA